MDKNLEELLESVASCSTNNIKIDIHPGTKDWRESFFLLQENGDIIKIARVVYSSVQKTIALIKEKSISEFPIEIKETPISDIPELLKTVKAAGFVLYGID